MATSLANESSPSSVGKTAASGIVQKRTAKKGFLWSLLADRAAVISIVLLVTVALVAIFAPFVAPFDPNESDFQQISKPPNSTNLLGTDQVGRDILSRVIYGSRVSLMVAVIAVTISLSLGLVLGSLSGFFGGWVDTGIQRITEVFMAFPSLLLIITVATALGPSIRNAIVIIGALGWITASRLMRVEFMSLKERDYVLAARSIGVTAPRVMVKHILPNASGPLIVNAVFGLRGAILAEAGLSFLGVGVPPPTASWGNMINIANSMTYLEGMPWSWLPPTGCLIAVVVAFSFLGDSIARISRG